MSDLLGQERGTHRAAPRVQQIVVAERVLDGQGSGAWPACTGRMGYSSADAGGFPIPTRADLSGDLRSDVGVGVHQQVAAQPRD